MGRKNIVTNQINKLTKKLLIDRTNKRLRKMNQGIEPSQLNCYHVSNLSHFTVLDFPLTPTQLFQCISVYFIIFLDEDEADLGIMICCGLLPVMSDKITYRMKQSAKPTCKTHKYCLFISHETWRDQQFIC